MKLTFLLYVIILGLVLNLLANMIWKYFPGTDNYLDKIITAILVFICIILLVFYKEESKNLSAKELAEIVAKIVSKYEKELASIRQERGRIKQLLASSLRRVQELEQRGDIKGVLEQLRKSGDTSELLRVLVQDRDKHKDDLIERNREIATIAYLNHNMKVAADAVNGILRLDPEDLEALNVQANIFWLTGHRDMEKVFNHLLEIAKKKMISRPRLERW